MTSPCKWLISQFQRAHTTSSKNCVDQHREWLCASPAYPHLVPAVQSAFQRKFSQMGLVVCNARHTLEIGFGCMYSKKIGRPKSVGGSVAVNGRWNAFLPPYVGFLATDFFENTWCIYASDFGASQKNAHNWRKAARIIFKYCMESLTEQELRQCAGNAFEEICEPLEKLTRVTICNKRLEKSLGLHKWFPNAFWCKLSCQNCVRSQRHVNFSW